jgi:hypothetical protein
VTYTVNEFEQVVEPYTATRMETVVEDVLEDYTVSVQVPVVKEVQVQVCKMVPKLVPYTFNPCAGESTSSMGGQVIGGSTESANGCGGGCGSAVKVGTAGCGCH